MLRLISDNPPPGLELLLPWLAAPADAPPAWPACCDIPEDDLKSDLLPLKRLVALANRWLITSSSPSPTPIAAATAIAFTVLLAQDVIPFL